MSKILFFGGTRYMGKHAVKELIAKGHSVTIATRGKAADDFGNGVNRLLVDRTHKSDLMKAMSGQVYDVVIDSLAYCSNDVKYLMEAVQFKRYIEISSSSVYPNLHDGMVEEEFDAHKKALVYCNREDFPYDEIKRQAECAIVQEYSHIPSVRIRFPYVIGPDDYTNRLRFYVEHVVNQKPMFVDNLPAQIAFVRSDEAGRFIAYLADHSFTGAINGANPQTVSIEEILAYVSQKTGKEPVLTNTGDLAPYNGVEDYWLDTGRAAALGFTFSPLAQWIFGLVDYYIENLGL